LEYELAPRCRILIRPLTFVMVNPPDLHLAREEVFSVEAFRQPRII
jgi:hypothetical protein